MSIQIIIRKKNSYGKSRAEQESNLRKDGFRAVSDDNFARLKYLEKKLGMKEGWINQSNIESGYKIRRGD